MERALGSCASRRRPSIGVDSSNALSASLSTSMGHLDRAQELLQSALSLANEANDDAARCSALNAIGALAAERGRPGPSKSQLRGCPGNRCRFGSQNRWLGGLHGKPRSDAVQSGEAQGSAAALPRGTRSGRTGLGNRRWSANTRCNLGLLYHEMGESDKACDLFMTALVGRARNGSLPTRGKLYFAISGSCTNPWNASKKP